MCLAFTPPERNSLTELGLKADFVNFFSQQPERTATNESVSLCSGDFLPRLAKQ